VHEVRGHRNRSLFRSEVNKSYLSGAIIYGMLRLFGWDPSALGDLLTPRGMTQ
jgi:hypothetical protein